MGYSIGLKTQSPEQAKEILAYINAHVPTLSDIMDENNYDDIDWATGESLAYINDHSVIGFDYSYTGQEAMALVYSLFYDVAHKFNALEYSFGKNRVIVIYDDDERWIVDSEYPFEEDNNPDGWGYIQLNERNIRPVYESSWLMRLLGSAKKIETKIEAAILKLPPRR